MTLTVLCRDLSKTKLKHAKNSLNISKTDEGSIILYRTENAKNKKERNQKI